MVLKQDLHLIKDNVYHTGYIKIPDLIYVLQKAQNNEEYTEEEYINAILTFPESYNYNRDLLNDLLNVQPINDNMQKSLNALKILVNVYDNNIQCKIEEFINPPKQIINKDSLYANVRINFEEAYKHKNLESDETMLYYWNLKDQTDLFIYSIWYFTEESENIINIIQYLINYYNVINELYETDYFENHLLITPKTEYMIDYIEKELSVLNLINNINEPSDEYIKEIYYKIKDLYNKLIEYSKSYEFIENQEYNILQIKENTKELNDNIQIVESLSNENKEYSEKIKNISDEINDSNKITTDQQNEIISLKEKIDRNNSLIQNYTQKIKSLEEKIEDRTKSIENLFKSPLVLGLTLSGLIIAYSNVIKGVVDKIKNILSGSNDLLNSIFNTIKDSKELIAAAVGIILAINDPKSFIGSILNLLVMPFEAILSAVNLIVCSIKAILCFLTSIIKTIGQFIEFMTGIIKKLTEKNTDLVSDIQNQSTEKFKENLNNAYILLLKGYAQNLIYSLSTSVYKKLGEDKAKIFTDKALEVCNNCFDSNKDSILNIIGTEIDRVTNKLSNDAKTAVDNLINLSNAFTCKGYYKGGAPNFSIDFSKFRLNIPYLDSSKFACINKFQG